MKAASSCILLSTLVCIAMILGSCTNQEKHSKSAHKRQNAINLFPEEPAYENGKVSHPMAYKEAVAKSVLVLRTSEVILVDKSIGRGNKPLYLYKVLSGKAIKPAKYYKKKYPIYFIANQDLLTTKSLQVVFIFLQNIQHNKILTKQRKIKYQWVNGAPVISA